MNPAQHSFKNNFIILVASMIGYLFLVIKPIHAQTQLPDLNVTYISTTPRYFRYCVEYINNVPVLCPGTEQQKRWPSTGEQITYTAHVINKGASMTELAPFRWKLKGLVQTTGLIPALSSNEEKIFSFSTTWTNTFYDVEFEADYTGSVAEITDHNNSKRVGSNDITISYWVEKPLYDLFNKTKNSLGSYSFEDWAQAHIYELNMRLLNAVYTPTSPNGVPDRVHIDKFIIADELDGPNSPMHTDPDLYHIDGRWQSTDGDATNAKGLGGFYQQYVNDYITKIDWGVVHEITHQLGVPDLYHMRLPQAPPNNGIQILGLSGQPITRFMLPNDGESFPYADLMGGGDIRPYTDHTVFSSHTAAGLNSNSGKRRGYYAEYYFDTPDTTRLQILDKNGGPVRNAQVNLYQRNPDTEIFDNTAELTGMTDAQGMVFILNRSVTPVTTATGHTLKSNPFGQIRVAGTNATMIVKVTQLDKEGYGYLLLHDLNMHYWNGEKLVATIPIQTTYLTSTTSPTPSPSLSVTQFPQCPAKIRGDADCKKDPLTQKDITIIDFEIWRKEFFTQCSKSNLSGCGTDDDLDGSLMDSDFNYTGSGNLPVQTDPVVDLIDYNIWRRGYFP